MEKHPGRRNRCLSLFMTLLGIIILTAFIFTGCARIPGCSRVKPTVHPPPVPTPTAAIDDSEKLKTIEDVEKRLKDENIMGDLENALEILDKELEKDPDNTKFLTFRLKILWPLQRIDEAVETADRLLAINPDNEYILYFKTKILLKYFRNDEAEQSLKRLKEIDPKNRKNRMMEGWMLLQMKKYDEAERVLKSLIKDHPEYVDAYLWLSDVYEEINREDEGMEFVSRSLERAWPDKEQADLLTRLAEYYERKGDIEGSVKYFKKALELNPANVRARARYAMSLGELKDYDAMREEIEIALKYEKEKESPYPYYALAILEYDSGRYLSALKSLFKAIKQYPLNSAGYILLGNFALNEQEYRQAQNAFLRAKARKPDDYKAMLGEARIAIVRRDFESAEKILSSIKPPEHLRREHYMKIGETYADHLRDYSTASKYYKKAMENTGGGKEPEIVLIRLAQVELVNNRDAAADKYFSRAAVKYPHNIFVNKELISAALDLNRYDIARKYIALWEKKNPRWSDSDLTSFYEQWINSAMFNGDLDEASEIIEKFEKIDPESPQLYDKKGVMADIKGDNKRADYFFDKSIENLLEESKINLSPGSRAYREAFDYSVSKKKKEAAQALRKACEIDIFNACRVYCDPVFNWMKDDEFFTKDLPELLKQVKDKTTTPSTKDLVW